MTNRILNSDVEFKNLDLVPCLFVEKNNIGEIVYVIRFVEQSVNKIVASPIPPAVQVVDKSIPNRSVVSSTGKKAVVAAGIAVSMTVSYSAFAGQCAIKHNDNINYYEPFSEDDNCVVSVSSGNDGLVTFMLVNGSDLVLKDNNEIYVSGKGFFISNLVVSNSIDVPIWVNDCVFKFSLDPLDKVAVSLFNGDKLPSVKGDNSSIEYVSMKLVSVNGEDSSVSVSVNCENGNVYSFDVVDGVHTMAYDVDAGFVDSSYANLGLNCVDVSNDFTYVTKLHGCVDDSSSVDVVYPMCTLSDIDVKENNGNDYGMWWTVVLYSGVFVFYKFRKKQ